MAVLKNTYTIYTDGSCIMEPDGRRSGGSAWMIFKGTECLEKQSIGFNDAAITNNRCELLAIYIPVMKIHEKADIVIYTDSQYCIKVFGNRTKVFPKNMDLVNQWREATEGMNITFVWVKGHNRNVFNEECDKMARAMSKSSLE